VPVKLRNTGPQARWIIHEHDDTWAGAQAQGEAT